MSQVSDSSKQTRETNLLLEDRIISIISENKCKKPVSFFSFHHECRPGFDRITCSTAETEVVQTAQTGTGTFIIFFVSE
jgi:hypothetical protein